MSPVITPLSMMSAFSVGRYSVARVCTSWSTTTSDRSLRYGRRYSRSNRISTFTLSGSAIAGGGRSGQDGRGWRRIATQFAVSEQRCREAERAEGLADQRHQGNRRVGVQPPLVRDLDGGGNRACQDS